MIWKKVTTSTKNSPIKAFDYKSATQAILKTLKRDRDRQVIARRFGFGLARRQTLEQIGKSFGITRERVRQIEKATMTKIASQPLAEIAQANRLLSSFLESVGGLATLGDTAQALGAHEEQDQSFIIFLSTLTPDIFVIDEDDDIRAGLTLKSEYTAKTLKDQVHTLVSAVRTKGEPTTIEELAKSSNLSVRTIKNTARLAKQLAEFDGKWGLVSWPQVNPKSIRDKTYLVLGKHGKPMHFTEISSHIRNSNFRRSDVTVQAVHNELIKDVRFILIGRGIYALAEWGYTPGTVADIIVDVLRDESPLHKDEIVKRVLQKRQVRTTTIVLNLQEKNHFERVAKATYRLRDKA